MRAEPPRSKLICTEICARRARLFDRIVVAFAAGVVAGHGALCLGLHGEGIEADRGGLGPDEAVDDLVTGELVLSERHRWEHRGGDERDEGRRGAEKADESSGSPQRQPALVMAWLQRLLTPFALA